VLDGADLDVDVVLVGGTFAGVGVIGVDDELAIGADRRVARAAGQNIAARDAAGTVTFTSGTTPSAFVANTGVTVATVSFNSAYATAAPRGIVLHHAGNASAAISTGASAVAFYAEASTASATQFLIKAVSAGTPTLAASTAYALAYVVIQ
jgi:hypothetical protein